MTSIDRRLLAAYKIHFNGKTAENTSYLEMANHAIYIRTNFLSRCQAKNPHPRSGEAAFQKYGCWIETPDGGVIDCLIKEDAAHWQDAFDDAKQWLIAIADFGYEAERQLQIENTADLEKRNRLLGTLRELPHGNRKLRMKKFYGDEPYRRYHRLLAEANSLTQQPASTKEVVTEEVTLPEYTGA
jgi:hypothetical protein